jgi:hypothetical protein
LSNTLCRYGITLNDVLRGINDTTNSALLTGLLLAEGRAPAIRGTTCQMHAQELVVQHALGLRKRTKNGDDVDTFEPGRLLAKKVRVLVSKIMDKRSKNKFTKYIEYCSKDLTTEVNRLITPNDTRVSGIFLMFESVLRSRTCIMMYTTVSSERAVYKDIGLNDIDWQFIAEIHSILKVMNLLAMTSQQQSVESNCFSYYHVVSARFYLKSSSEFPVIDINKDNWKPTTEMSKIPTTLILKENLMAHTVELIDRFEAEFLNYFKAPDSDQILMMVFHPLMAWMGFE